MLLDNDESIQLVIGGSAKELVAAWDAISELFGTTPMSFDYALKPAFSYSLQDTSFFIIPKKAGRKEAYVHIRNKALSEILETFALVKRTQSLPTLTISRINYYAEGELVHVIPYPNKFSKEVNQ